MLTDVNSPEPDGSASDDVTGASPTTAARRYLDAALRVLENRGPGEITVRTVGEAAGVSGPAIYRHFRDKKGLLIAAYDAAAERWTAAIFDRDAEGVAAARMRETLERYHRFAVDHGAIYHLLFSPPPEFVDAGVDVAGVKERTLSRLTEIVRECMVAGALLGDDPHAVALTLWSTMHGLLSLYRPSAEWRESDRAAFRTLFGDTVARVLRSVT